jgi:dTDP-4-amino-4,6-dideoxygalactose transaminase
MKVSQLDLVNQYNSIKEEISSAINNVLESGIVINGENVKKLEDTIARYSSVQYGIGVANGSDAIFIALKAIGIGKDDAVICPPFTFFATAGSIVRAGGTPVFVDIDSDTYNLDENMLQRYINNYCDYDNEKKELIQKSSNKIVRAIIPVHLYGQMCKMDEIMKIAHKYNIKVVEDCAQSIGSEYQGKRAGSYGDLSTFSFFPTKNLGTYGDGGMICTNNKNLADYCKVFRAHGSQPKYYHKFVGINSRLDELHAAILNVKFKYLDKWLEDRFQAADRYQKLFEKYNLQNKVRLPIKNVHSIKNHKEHTFHQYVIYVENRDKLQKYLKENGIGTNIYYPLSLHLQECFKDLGYKEGDFPVSEDASNHVLAIPMYPELSLEQQEYVVEKIYQFYN